MSDIVLETARALATALILLLLYRTGRRERLAGDPGWRFLTAGFVLILFGSLIDISDNFPSLDRFVVIGDTPVQAVLEELVGYLCGFVLVAIGFYRWLPAVLRQREAREQLNRSNEELERKVRSRTEHLSELNRKLVREINARRQAEEGMKFAKDEAVELARQLREISVMDGLTGIANRRKLEEVLAREWARATREGRPIGFMMLDLDCFKAFNDYYGHQTGDDCLRRVAQALARHLRRPGDLVARYGGEEFAAILSDTPAREAGRIAEEMRGHVESLAIAHASNDAGPVVTISVGTAMLVPNEGMSAKYLIEMADAGLYRAKHEGKNRVVVTGASLAPVRDGTA